VARLASPCTVRYLYVLLHRSLKRALLWNLVPRNVARAVDPPRIHRKEIHPLSPSKPVSSWKPPEKTAWKASNGLRPSSTQRRAFAALLATPSHSQDTPLVFGFHGCSFSGWPKS
jgi:hypothetical protein